MWDIYNRQFNLISFIFHPEGNIYHYSSCIEVSISNGILFVVSINNIRNLFINGFIIVVLRKYYLLHFHSIVTIKIIHHYLILNEFLEYLSNKDLS